jgi:hypothetical protein
MCVLAYVAREPDSQEGTPKQTRVGWPRLCICRYVIVWTVWAVQLGEIST